MTKPYPYITDPATHGLSAAPPHTIRGSVWGRKSARSNFTPDLAALILATAIGFLADPPIAPQIAVKADLLWPLAVVVVVLTSLLLNHAWDNRSRSLRGADFRAPCHAYAWAIASLSLIWSMLGGNDQRVWILCTLPLALALTLAFRKCLASLTRRRTGRDVLSTSVIIVGSRPGVSAFLTRIKSKPVSYWSMDAVCLAGAADRAIPTAINTVPVVGVEADLVDLVRRNGHKMVILLQSAAWGPGQVRELMWRLEGTGVDVLLAPPLVDIASTRLDIAAVAGVPLLHLRERPQQGVERLAKAAFDRLAAVIGIVVILPVLLAIALGVRLTSKGPALYRQTRLGMGQRPFTIYKFRTMVIGAELMTESLDIANDSSGPLFKSFTDPRVTRVGRLLRRYSLDELPQLFNVALGSMSLVGPRPPLASEVRQYTSENETRRLLVRPGITGLWQVSGRSDLSWEESIRHDLFYVENWSIGLDATILWKTIGAVSSGRGAY